MTEWEKMVSGALYDPADPELQALARRRREVEYDFNHSRADASELLAGLFARTGPHFYVEPGFHCDYGRNISVGDHFYANAGVTILDVCPVRIGENCLIGPKASIFTAAHPADGGARRTLLEFGRPVTIGDDVWIGGHAVINPGVTIGSNVVVASGAVVTKDVPDNCVVGGSPARIIRRLAPMAGPDASKPEEA